MKWLLIPALLLLSQLASAQTKLPRMTMQEGLGTKFQVGDLTLTRRAAFDYLQKNQNATGEAYALFKKGNEQNAASWIWLATACIGAGLSIYGIAQNPDKGITSAPALAGIGILAVGSTGALIASFSASKYYRRSVEAYNHFAGY